MENIYNSIRKEIINHPKIKNSILNKVEHWKRGQYVILSEIISDNLSKSEELKNDKKYTLGTTISHITLQRFFENDYQSKTHNDLRFLKTLDKICIFLGYYDLNAYISNFKNNSIENIPHSHPFYENIIHKYCENVFEMYTHFPNLHLHYLEDYLFPDSPFLERINQFGNELCQSQFQLITYNNRSNFEVFNLKIIKEEPNKIVVESQEFWNLLFQNKALEEEYFVNQLNTQVYFLRKINHQWKIWDNYNPDAGILNKTIKKP